MRSALAALSLLLTIAAARPPDPLLATIIAGARAAAPATTAFERTSRTTATEEKGAPETHVRVDRWDGKMLVPLTIDGKPASADQIAEVQKAAKGRPVAGYHRLADFLQGGAVRGTDAQGHTIYRIAGLPKGTINVGKDISADLVGEASIDTSTSQPFVWRLRVYLPKPLSFFMVAKLDAFEIINDYRPGPGGKPALVKGVQSMTGAQFGKSGTTRTETSYTILK
ncbi:MAG: hypothetical protein H7267_07690 [Sandarakinorhabdus sp.]|nr:hypothetical protein [Sandarakinorhabdus sp.]